MLLRAWGHGMRPCVIQFIKSRKGRWGEIKAAERLGIEWHRLGDGFVRRHGMARSADPEEGMDKARETWELAQTKIASGDYDLIILDEFTYPLKEGWVDTERVVAWLGEHKPSGLHLVITGRHAPAELLALADLVTEMGKLKHPYDRGIGAQAGIEF
jgi:cob(I)alamin adenosyltransferase